MSEVDATTEIPTLKIPVWQTVGQAYRFVFTHLGQFLKLLIPAIILFWLINFFIGSPKVAQL